MRTTTQQRRLLHRRAVHRRSQSRARGNDPRRGSGGSVIVSDITWRDQPGTLGSEWRWVANAAQTTTDEHLAELISAGLLVSRVTVHGRDAGTSTGSRSHRGRAEIRHRRPVGHRRRRAKRHRGTPRRRRLARLHHLHHRQVSVMRGQNPLQPGGRVSTNSFSVQKPSD